MNDHFSRAAETEARHWKHGRPTPARDDGVQMTIADEVLAARLDVTERRVAELSREVMAMAERYKRVIADRLAETVGRAPAPAGERRTLFDLSPAEELTVAIIKAWHGFDPCHQCLPGYFALSEAIDRLDRADVAAQPLGPIVVKLTEERRTLRFRLGRAEAEVAALRAQAAELLRDSHADVCPTHAEPATVGLKPTNPAR